jgi:hypothetical protein
LLVFGWSTDLRYNELIISKSNRRRCPLKRPQSFSPGGGLISGVVLAVLLGLIFFVWRTVLPQDLFAWTGEERTTSQVVALWNLVAGQLRAMPETKPHVPVAYTGQNPFGVNTFMEQEVEPAKRERICQMVSDAGFGWIRQEFPWEDIEIHGKGDFEDRRHEPHRSAWEKYDNIIELASKYDLNIIARLSNPPAWSRAAGDESGSFAPPDNLEDYGDFVHAFAERYGDQIQYYQIWNEPNIYPEWGESPADPEAYTELLKVGYRRIKEADPDAVIIAGSLAATIEMDGYPHGMNDFVFLQRMYDAGAKDYFDIMAVQGYGLWSGPSDRRMRPRVLNFSRPQYIRDIMIENGDENKPIWMTEMNWNAIPADHPAYPMFGRVTEREQADYAVQAYRRAQAEWPWMGVMNVWFFKRASDAEQDQPMYYFRMVEPDFNPMPIYGALKEEAHRRPVMYPGYHQEDHWAVSYQGDWRQTVDSDAVLGGYRESRNTGDSIQLLYSGTDLSLVLAEGSEGTLSVSCGDEPPSTQVINQISSGESQPIAVCGGMDDGVHEVSIQILSTQSGIANIRADGFVVRRNSAWKP